MRISNNSLIFDSTNLAGVAIEYELSDLRERCTCLSGKEIKEEVGDIPDNQAKYFSTEVSGSDGNPALKWEYNKIHSCNSL